MSLDPDKYSACSGVSGIIVTNIFVFDMKIMAYNRVDQ